MTTTDLAISHAQAARESEDPVQFILSCCWISLSLLYVELIQQKEIPWIEELDPETKLRYWRLTNGSRFKRIGQVRALFVYDLLNQSKDATTATDKPIESPGIVG